MVLLKNVGFVVGKQQFCGGGGDDFAGGEHHENGAVDGDVVLNRMIKIKMLLIVMVAM